MQISGSDFLSNQARARVLRCWSTFNHFFGSAKKSWTKMMLSVGEVVADNGHYFSDFWRFPTYC